MTERPEPVEIHGTKLEVSGGRVGWLDALSSPKGEACTRWRNPRAVIRRDCEASHRAGGDTRR